LINQQFIFGSIDQLTIGSPNLYHDRLALKLSFFPLSIYSVNSQYTKPKLDLEYQIKTQSLPGTQTLSTFWHPLLLCRAHSASLLALVSNKARQKQTLLPQFDTVSRKRLLNLFVTLNIVVVSSTIVQLVSIQYSITY